MSKKRILVIGSLNMDLVINSPKIPAIGETLLGSSFMTSPGGKGANQAVAAARLGGNVAMIGNVGNDIFGKSLIENLSKNSVDASNIGVSIKFSTGVAMIIVKDGDNCIIVDPGANASLADTDFLQIDNEISKSDFIMVQLEIPVEVVEKVIYSVKKQNKKILLNPAPAIALSDELLSLVDVFTPNESECKIITGIEINNIEDAKQAVLYLNNKGINTAIITMGKNGVIYNSGSRIIHKPVPKVKVVDTTAAGDSFSGALAVALTEGMDIDAAVDFANKVGTLTVTKKGAQASLPTRDMVDAFKILI